MLFLDRAGLPLVSRQAARRATVPHKSRTWRYAASDGGLKLCGLVCAALAGRASYGLEVELSRPSKAGTSRRG